MFLKFKCSKLRAIEESDFDLLYNLLNDIDSMTIDTHLPVSLVSQIDFAKLIEIQIRV